MEVPMLNGSVLALVWLVITFLLVYAIFSIAIDARAIRRLLERQEARDQSSV
jgi:hypothetical protein